jgi:drug/metabolite transporter (DMT)-like permease
LTTPVSSMALVLGGSVIGSIGAVFLKSGAMALGKHWSTLLLNWRLVVGVLTYLLSSVLFVKGMSHGELSVLFPMVSLSYICSLVWSKLLFNETVTKAKVYGIGMILVGIICLGLGSA